MSGRNAGEALSGFVEPGLTQGALMVGWLELNRIASKGKETE